MSNTPMFASKCLSNGYRVSLAHGSDGAVVVTISCKGTVLAMTGAGISSADNGPYTYSSVGRREYAATALAGWQWARSKCYVSRETYVLGRQLLLMNVCRTRIREHRGALTRDSAILLTELMRVG